MRRRFYRSIVAAALLTVGLLSAPVTPAFADVAVDTPEELAEAFRTSADGSVIELGADIVVAPDDPAIAVPVGNLLRLDLGGHRLEIRPGGRPGILVPNQAHLVIRDGAGGGRLIAAGDGDAAGIGGANGTPNLGNAGMITIESGSVTATSPNGGAAIGGGFQGNVEGITITGGSVTATSRSGAGIGASEAATAGPIRIEGGTVKATSTGGAGIGAGVTAISGPIRINGGTVVATSLGDGAGIGCGAGNRVQSGSTYGSVEIGEDAVVTAVAKGRGSAIGAGYYSDSRGLFLVNRGWLTIPAGSTLRVGEAATASNRGTITGSGTVTGSANRSVLENDGSIRATVTVSPPLDVTHNNYRLTFAASESDGGSTPDDVTVYAPTLAAAGLSVPAERPTRTGYTFSGWFQSNGGSADPLTADTDLGTGVAGEVPFHAGWSEGEQQAPRLTGGTEARFTVGQPGAYTPKVAGRPAPTVTAKGMPEGLVLDPRTGVITGTPKPGTEGEHEVILTADNGIEPDATLKITVAIDPAPITSFELEAPDRARAGEKLKITGGGLPGGTEVLLQLGSDPTELGSVVAGDDGAFSFAATIPEDTEAGDHEVIATVEIDGRKVTETEPVRILDREPTLPSGSPTESPTDEPSGEPTDRPTREPSSRQSRSPSQESPSPGHPDPDDQDGSDGRNSGDDHGGPGEGGLPNTGSELPLGLMIGLGALPLAAGGMLLLGRPRPRILEYDRAQCDQPNPPHVPIRESRP
ncbi:putative Ig domain-containing protein [Microlunatus sp. GCM10028923]|uniref:putative Ig domain-containing protein n=1 Tax=Microlunatus sp. GCM10028923 TaxID=3273400 RepID=UPI0036112E06